MDIRAVARLERVLPRRVAEDEGEELVEGLQKFFTAVRTLRSEKRLSRIVYLFEKLAD